MGGKEIRRIWTGGGVTLGVVAAILSCISLARAVFAGDAGVVNPSAYEQCWPYLLVVAFALLALGFYSTYRPARGAVREPGSVHGRPSSALWTRRILWVAAAMVVVSAFAPYSGWLMRTVGRGPCSDRHIRQQATARVVLTIEGMDCPVCAAGLQNNLRQIPGVHRAEVSFQDKQADLDYDPRAIDPARLARLVVEMGFKVSGMLPANH